MAIEDDDFCTIVNEILHSASEEPKKECVEDPIVQEVQIALDEMLRMSRCEKEWECLALQAKDGIEALHKLEAKIKSLEAKNDDYVQAYHPEFGSEWREEEEVCKLVEALEYIRKIIIDLNPHNVMSGRNMLLKITENALKRGKNEITVSGS